MNPFKKIGALLKKFFSGAYNLLQDKGYIAVLVTQNLKLLLESPVLDILTAIIPGELDNIIVSKLRFHIPQVAYKVAKTHGVITATDRPSQALYLLFDYLRTLDQSEQAKFWIDFAAELNISLEDNHLSVMEALERTQSLYTRYFRRS